MKIRLPKKKIVFIVHLFLLFIMQLSCSLSDSKINERVVNGDEVNLKQNCQGISSETAVLIAQGYLFLAYDLRDRETEVETETELWKDKGEMWKVTFHRTKHRDWEGGDPVVWIFKSTGERFTVKHAK